MGLILDFHRVLGCAIATIALMLWTSAVPAQDAYPSKPVRVMVGLAPDGATDLQTRLFAQKLTESLGRPFVVENRKIQIHAGRK